MKREPPLKKHIGGKGRQGFGIGSMGDGSGSFHE
jgi:hypothetical protein